MSTLQHFPKLTQLPKELQRMVWKEAILADYVDRVVAVLHNSKQIVLTSDLSTPSKFLSLCQASRSAAESYYDVKLPAINSGIPGVVGLSTTLDVFFISAWGFTLGINVFGGLFEISATPLPSEELAKVERVMEHHLDLEDMIYQVEPAFDRAVFQSVRVCYLRLDHQRPILASLASQSTGPGPHTRVDLLDYCTNPSWYEEHVVTEVNEEETE
ncbi:hypothetical protein PG994_013403 [Apiospora phragmitis]|uniref:2EXR domain-containing protein n=1 Tax=Apiospora phragmitis TaxID=2905665 RepID=A0ABR1TAB1_9PEZI